MGISTTPLPLELDASLPQRARLSRQYKLLAFLFDLLAVTAAWKLTLELRLLLNPFMSLHLSRTNLESIAPPIGGVLVLWIAAALWLRIYRHASGLSAGTAVLRVLESVILSGTAIVVVTFFSRGMGTHLSRSFVFLFMPICFIVLACARYLALVTAINFERRWPSLERIGVIADYEHGCEVMSRIRNFGGGMVAGLILPGGGKPGIIDRPELVLGTISRLPELINTARIDRLVVIERNLNESELNGCIAASKRMGVIITRIIGQPEPDARPCVAELYGLRLLELRPVAFTRTQELLKRSFDVACSALLLMLLSPLLLLIMALVKITSQGDALYCSTRVGKGGRHFTFFKFRTMYSGGENRSGLLPKNEKDGHIFKVRNDPRVTPLGRFLRRWSLDELPQLVNVLRGDMSMVGPRPLPAKDLDPDGQSRQFKTWADQRSRVLPGITGLWQIRGRSDLPFQKMVELDVQYISEWSLGVDLRILFETPLVLISGRGAY